MHSAKFNFRLKAWKQVPEKTEAGQSSRERVRTASALLRVLWVFAGLKSSDERSFRFDLSSRKGVVGRRHRWDARSRCIAYSPEPLLKGASSSHLSMLEFGNVRMGFHSAAANKTGSPAVITRPKAS